MTNFGGLCSMLNKISNVFHTLIFVDDDSLCIVRKFYHINFLLVLSRFSTISVSSASSIYK